MSKFYSGKQRALWLDCTGYNVVSPDTKPPLQRAPPSSLQLQHHAAQLSTRPSTALCPIVQCPMPCSCAV